jgi:ribonucleoside-diphosphate reductase alpha chain
MMDHMRTMTDEDVKRYRAEAQSAVADGLDPRALNAELNIWGAGRHIQFERDLVAEQSYMITDVEPNEKRFPTEHDRVHWLVDNGYYEHDLVDLYTDEFIDRIHGLGRSEWKAFGSFMGVYKFYQQYAMRTGDGKTHLEDFVERAVATALKLAQGDEDFATRIAHAIITRQYQPATPTFLNAGKVRRGEYVSCYLLRTEDNMESIGRNINSALQLSKRGGGVALGLSNLREQGAPIKGIENQSSGVVPVMKILEDSFSYANQLGARQGAGAVYLHMNHPDIMRFLDTKRENADEKIRIKTLSLGIVVPDVAFRLARENADMALFSPYGLQKYYGKGLADIGVSDHYDELAADPRVVAGHVNVRKLFTTIAELQFESGYPYLMFEDTVNRENPIPGRIVQSNLCSEILQSQEPSEYDEDLSYKSVGIDVSCNLGSLNVARAFESGDLGGVVNTAVRSLTAVSELTDVGSVPSLRKANDTRHTIGLGEMNLHGFLMSHGLAYGSPEALEFVDAYFRTVSYHAILTSNKLAIERGERFQGFEESGYADGSYFDRFTSRTRDFKYDAVRRLFDEYRATVPTVDDWNKLRESVIEHGIFNAYLQAVPPTGSISYINGSTSSIHPVAAAIEIRKEGKTGRVYYPAYGLTDENVNEYKDAYQIGPRAIIDTYAAAQPYVDQGMSLTLFYPDTVTTRDVVKNYIYAWSKGVKTLYYMRLRQAALDGTEVDNVSECISCQL